MPAADGVSFYLLCSECAIVQYSGSRGYDCGFCGNEHVVFAGCPVSFSWCESQCGVAHAYQILAYIFASGNPIKSGDSIDGFRGGYMDPSVQWRVQYENAMLPPARKLLDVNMGAYAAGVRE